MGAKISFIFAAEAADLGFVRRAITALEPEIGRTLGSLKTASVHNITSDRIRESTLGEILGETIAVISHDEIVTLYSDRMQDGCVMVNSEGRFTVITIALQRVCNPIDFLLQCWRRIGSDLSAALMGEELEVSEKELNSLITNGRIPPDADLCEAAIVRTRVGTPSIMDGTGVEYGGTLLRS